MMPPQGTQETPDSPGGVSIFFREFQKYAAQDGTSGYWILAVAAALVALLLFWQFIIRPRLDRRRDLDDLFLDLARVSRLEKDEIQYLRRAAAFHQLDNPSVLFVRRSLLEAYEERGRDRSPGMARELVGKLYL